MCAGTLTTLSQGGRARGRERWDCVIGISLAQQTAPPRAAADKEAVTGKGVREFSGIAWQGVRWPQTGWFAAALEGDLAVWLGRNHWIWGEAAPFLRELLQSCSGCRLSQGW